MRAGLEAPSKGNGTGIQFVEHRGRLRHNYALRADLQIKHGVRFPAVEDLSAIIICFKPVLTSAKAPTLAES